MLVIGAEGGRKGYQLKKDQVSKVIFFSLATTTDAIAESSLALQNDLDTDMLALHACCFFITSDVVITFAD